MAQSQPIGVYTTEQVICIAKRAKRDPGRVTPGEVRILALHALALCETQER
jgi:hypothetical protein